MEDQLLTRLHLYDVWSNSLQHQEEVLHNPLLRVMVVSLLRLNFLLVVPMVPEKVVSFLFLPS